MGLSSSPRRVPTLCHPPDQSPRLSCSAPGPKQSCPTKSTPCSLSEHTKPAAAAPRGFLGALGALGGPSRQQLRVAQHVTAHAVACFGERRRFVTQRVFGLSERAVPFVSLSLEGAAPSSSGLPDVASCSSSG